MPASLKRTLQMPGKPLQNDAPMAAREASHAVIVKLLVKNALDGTLRENVFEGAGFSGPGCQSPSPKWRELTLQILSPFQAVAKKSLR